jgi:HD superfamily phosphohydrolase YqeK
VEIEVIELKEELYKIVKSISDISIKVWTEAMLSVAPAAFWDKAASSTGKYHKADENGVNGQVVHTLRVCAVVVHLVNMEKLTVVERDILLSAAVIHDICKYGVDGKTEHTLLEHPLLVDKLRQNSIVLLPSCAFDQAIIETVEQHSGRWSSEPILNPTKLGKLLHIADFVASRNNIEVRLDK